MKKLLTKLKEIVIDITTTALTFLCLGVVVQLLINDDIFGWNPVENIREAGGAFTGAILLVVLYLLFIDKKKK